MKTNQKRIFYGVLLTSILLILFYFRTWFHGLVMFFYTRPVLLEALAIWAVLHILVFRSIKAKKVLKYKNRWGNKQSTTISFNWLSYLVLSLLIVGGLIVAPILTQRHIAGEVDYSYRGSLPETSEDIRLTPNEVAYRYARDSLQLSQYKLGTENIAVVNDRISWVFPLVPDGAIIKFTLKNKGMTYIDATIQNRNSSMVWKEMAIGDGMYITDNLWWNLYKHHYFIDTEDPYYIPDNEEIYTVVPAISYSHHFRWGVWYTVPEFKGSIIVNTDGDIELLSPEEALDRKVLKDNIVFPEKLTRLYVESYQYHLGMINKFFIHEDQIQIQDINGGTHQPFLMNTEEGLKWFVSTEPYGVSHGIFKIFLADAQTGNIEIYDLPQDKILTGPIRASDYVRQSNPVVDWNRFIMAEPLPFIRDNILYWKVAVIPEDAAGIAYQAFVNSSTNQVVEIRSDEEIKLFIAGEMDEIEPDQDIDLELEEILKLLDQLKNRVEKLIKAE